MKLLEMALEFFKGARSVVLTFDDILTIICGKNGTGKTTLATAWTWVWTDKDYDLQSNPDVRCSFAEESEASVTIKADVNGKVVHFRKYQVDLRSKKQKEQNAPVRIANRYEINSVPKTQKDFFADVEAMGINVDIMLMLMHPDILMGMKIQDRRKVVFGMADGVTDLDVAKAVECKEVIALLEQGYTLDEITAMTKASDKKCKENLDVIPNQIIGMEKAKIEVNPDLPKLKADIEEEIKADVAKRTDAMAKANADAINARIRELTNRKQALYNEANMERLSTIRKIHEEADAIDDKLTEAKRKLYKIESDGSAMNDAYKAVVAQGKQYASTLKELKKEKFSGSEICPTCGQKIPKESIDKAKLSWKEHHDAESKNIENKMQVVRLKVESYKADGKKLAQKKAEAVKTVDKLKEDLLKKKNELLPFQEPVTPDYSEIDAEIAKLKEEKDKCDDYAKLAYTINDAIAKKKDLLQSYIRQMAREENNKFIDEQIADAKEQLRIYAQKKADAENILYQIQLIGQKKNEMLSDQVNSNFTRVKFRLFTYLKNGDIKDDCTPMVLCSDGEYRDMTYSANTAAIMAAKIDICVGLQKHYGQTLPIWVDGAECFDEENRKKLKTDRQLVLLCVTEDERLTVKK